MILQSAGNDFTRTRAAAIDQHDNRQPIGDIAGLRIPTLRIFLPARAGGDNFPLRQEIIGNLHSLIEQTARIIAHIQDQALKPTLRLLLQLLQSAAQPGFRLLIEGCDAHIAQIAIFQAEADNLRTDNIARQCQFNWPFRTLATNGDLYLRVALAAHLFHGLLQGQALHGSAI